MDIWLVDLTSNTPRAKVAPVLGPRASDHGWARALSGMGVAVRADTEADAVNIAKAIQALAAAQQPAIPLYLFSDETVLRQAGYEALSQSWNNFTVFVYKKI